MILFAVMLFCHNTLALQTDGTITMQLQLAAKINVRFGVRFILDRSVNNFIFNVVQQKDRNKSMCERAVLALCVVLVQRQIATGAASVMATATLTSTSLLFS